MRRDEGFKLLRRNALSRGFSIIMSCSVVDLIVIVVGRVVIRTTYNDQQQRFSLC